MYEVWDLTKSRLSELERNADRARLVAEVRRYRHARRRWPWRRHTDASPLADKG